MALLLPGGAVRGWSGEPQKNIPKDEVLRAQAPRSLKAVPVPRMKGLEPYVADRKALKALGKALFFEEQVGSDARVGCATCHIHAGADARVVNTLNPGANGTFEAGAPMSRVTEDLFPFHKLENPDDRDSKVLHDFDDIVGSQGVRMELFEGLNLGSGVEDGNAHATPDPIFNVHGRNVRQVTGRNSPTTFNAVFLYRMFWDGRANHYFNGRTPFGPRDPAALIWLSDGHGLSQEQVLLPNGALASQAVGPPMSTVEMAFIGRTFTDLGRKLLALRRPLALQEVSPQDSLLGDYADPCGKGLDVSYEELIRQAFKRPLWDASHETPDHEPLIVANFSFFWGVAVAAYEETLVSDEAPYDRWAEGDDCALSPAQKRGLWVFLNQGKCINCHGGALFTNASIEHLFGHDRRDRKAQLIERMPMAKGVALYDSGFYNIGVRPTAEDLGVGGVDPFGNPLSFSRQATSGIFVDPIEYLIDPCKFQSYPCKPVQPGERVAVDGAFKTPTLRNVELTGPYFHNGGQSTLEQVVQFYDRGGDFHDENIANLDPDIEELNLSDQQKADLVAFLLSLTDERVRYERAPFDRPSISLPNGPNLPAVGANGGKRLRPFLK